MLAVGLALDARVYDRALSYQPAWLALPLGALELGLVYASMRIARYLARPAGRAPALRARLAVRAGLRARVASRALRLEYGESGGELGRIGARTGRAVGDHDRRRARRRVRSSPADRAPARHGAGTARDPPRADARRRRRARRHHRIRANHVTLRNVTVVGGEYGVNIEHAQHVMLDHVRVLHFDGSTRSARVDAGVMIDHCSITATRGPLATGILISYSMGRPMSMVSDCTIVGVREGIVDALLDGRRDGQSRRRHDRARHLARGDVDGHGERQPGRERARDRDHLHGPLDVRDQAQHDRRDALVDGTQTRAAAGSRSRRYFYAEAQSCTTTR